MDAPCIERFRNREKSMPATSILNFLYYCCENSCFRLLLRVFGTKWENWMTSLYIIHLLIYSCENACVRHLLTIFASKCQIRMPATYILNFLYQFQCFAGIIGPPRNVIFASLEMKWPDDTANTFLPAKLRSNRTLASITYKLLADTEWRF
jgi:hypothetical protein